MNTNNGTNLDRSPAAAPRGRRWKLAAVLALAAGVAASGIAFGGPVLHGHRGGHMAMSPAAMDAHSDKMVDECAAGASADQKARLSAIGKAAVGELRPAHEEIRKGHARLHELLVAPVIDHAALEQLRVAQMQRMDFISKRMLTAVEEGADVLTPDQRRQCAARLGALMH